MPADRYLINVVTERLPVEFSKPSGERVGRLMKNMMRLMVRLLFPSALLAIHEKGLKNKLIALFRHELRAHATPLKLSVSLSLGVFMAIFPVHGFQVALLLLMTVVFKLNRPVAMVGVSISTAPFLPFWIAAGVGAGELVVPKTVVGSLAAVISVHLPPFVMTWIQSLPVKGMLDGVVCWLLGSVILAVVCALITFAVSYPIIRKTGFFSNGVTSRSSEAGELPAD